MAESSHPRLPRCGHSALRPGSRGTTAPDRGRACLTVPGGDIDVSTTVTGRSRGLPRLPARTGTPTSAAPPPATAAAVSPDRTGAA